MKSKKKPSEDRAHLLEAYFVWAFQKFFSKMSIVTMHSVIKASLLLLYDEVSILLNKIDERD
jgi:hypothetical protein